jgi:hypothetical protein
MKTKEFLQLQVDKDKKVLIPKSLKSTHFSIWFDSASLKQRFPNEKF